MAKLKASTTSNDSAAQIAERNELNQEARRIIARTSELITEDAARDISLLCSDRRFRDPVVAIARTEQWLMRPGTHRLRDLRLAVEDMLWFLSCLEKSLVTPAGQSIFAPIHAV